MFSIPRQEAEALEQPPRHGVRSPAGNRLESVTNSGSEDAGTFSYTCDSSGNLSFDSRSGLDIQCNVLNLPGRIGTMGGTMSYTYLVDGTKVAAVVNLSAPASTPTDNAILEQNCYTPFGTRLRDSALKTQAANRWRYAGKEEQNISGMDLGLLDFGARYYDPYIARWTSIDPMAYKFSSFSPFNYCCGNPIGLYDLDGRIPIVLSIAGVAADYAFQVYLNYNEGITGKDAFTNVDYASLAMSAINPAKKLSFVGKCGVILVKNLTDAAIDTNSEDIVNTNVKDIASKTLTNSLVEGVSSTVGKFIEGKAISSKAATLEASKNYTHKTNLATKSHPSAKSNAEASKAKAEFESAIVAESAYDALNKTTYLYTPITEREIKKQLNEDTRH